MSKNNASIKVCVFGTGTFGTALGTVVARNGYTVTMLARKAEVVESINTKHLHPNFLTDYKLPPMLSATASVEDALKGVSFIIHAIPVQATQSFLEPIRHLISPDVPIISCSKGLHSETLETMAELVPRVLGRAQPMGFISGPTFAKELMLGNPSGAVLAADTMELADKCAAIFHCNALRIYSTTDVIGVEVGGALKNVYALAAGGVEGLGLGVNPLAFLVTRACAEMNMLAVAMGSKPQTMSGLAGIGDLMLTCMGGASRNKAVGARIGKGESLAKVMESLSEVAEGVATAPAAVKLAKKHGVDAPLANAVLSILEGKATPQQAIGGLMAMPRSECFSKHAHDAQARVEAGTFLGLPAAAWAGLALVQTVALVHLLRKRNA